MTDFNKTIHLKFDVDVNTKDAERALDDLQRRASGSGRTRHRPTYAGSGNEAHLDNDPYIFGNSYSGYSKSRDFQVSNSSDLKAVDSSMKSLSQTISELKDSIRSINNARNSTLNIGTRTSNRGHLTYADSRSIISNETVIEHGKSNINQDPENGPVGSFSKEYNKSLGERNKLYAKYKSMASDKSYSQEELDNVRKQIDQNTKLIDTYNKLEEAVKNADMAQSVTQATSTGLYSADPARGSMLYNLQQRAYSIGAHTVSSVVSPVTQMYSSGFSTNQATGSQALQVGTLIGGQSDTSIRKQAQNTSLKGGYGYTTQQGIDFYSDAIQRRGSVLSNSSAKEYVGNIERSGRASNLSDDTYKSLVSTLSGAGSLNKSSDITSIVSSIMTANQMSGNAGNYEQNASTITSLISSIANNRQVTAKDSSTLAANVSALQSGNSALQGTSGATQLQNINNAYTAASQGGNNALLYTIFRSRGQSGAVGLWNAKLQAEKGLTDTDNITAARNMFSRQINSGAQGRDIAASNIQQMFNVSASTADGLVKDIASGKYSDAELRARVEKALKSEAAKNTSAYDSSEQSALNTSTAEKETNSSKLKSSGTWLTRLGDAINTNPLAQIATGVGTSFVGTAMYNAGASGVASLLKGNKFSSLFNTASSVFKGAGTAGGVATAGKGIFSKIASLGKSAISKAPISELGVSGIKGLFSDGVGSGLKGLAKAGLEGAGKFAPAVTAGVDIYNIATAKNKGKAVGSAVGSGIGTIAGGLLGGVPGAIVGGMIGDWAGGKVAEGVEWVGGKLTRKGSRNSSSAVSANQIQDRETKSLLDKEDAIVNKREKWLKDYKDTLPDTSTTSSKSSTKSHKAFGGIVTGRTEIAEGNRSEYVVPLDPSKASYTKRALSQIQSMTGIRASDGKQIVATSGTSYSPNITVNASGSKDTRSADDIQRKIAQLMQNSMSNYRNNVRTV